MIEIVLERGISFGSFQAVKLHSDIDGSKHQPCPLTRSSTRTTSSGRFVLVFLEISLLKLTILKQLLKKFFIFVFSLSEM